MLSLNGKMGKFTVTLIIFASVISGTLAHRCYVCGQDAEDAFKDRPKSKRDTASSAGGSNSSKVAPKCDAIERGEKPDQFIMECPSGFNSCLTQIDDSSDDGQDVMRTCAEQQVNDCAIANGVIYCYCKDELCNSQTAQSLREQIKPKRKPEATHVKTPAPTDDEDLEESSGTGEIQYSSEIRKKQLSPSSSEQEATSKKNYMITLKPATEALNLTTSSPKADAASAANKQICSQHTHQLSLLMLANLIIISFLRIN